jgi:hypothetical protein
MSLDLEIKLTLYLRASAEPCLVISLKPMIKGNNGYAVLGEGKRQTLGTWGFSGRIHWKPNILRCSARYHFIFIEPHICIPYRRPCIMRTVQGLRAERLVLQTQGGYRDRFPMTYPFPHLASELRARGIVHSRCGSRRCLCARRRGWAGVKRFGVSNQGR